MAVTIIVYPEEGANSFISVVDASAIINDTLEAPSWEALDEDTQARWLIFAYNKIALLDGFVPPDTLDDSCLPSANAILALYSMTYNLNVVTGDQQLRVEKVGPLYNEYFKNEGLDRLSIGDYPPSVVACLEQYGATEFNTVDGVGVIPRTR